MSEPILLKIARKVLPAPARRFLKRLKGLLPSPDFFLKKSRGVIHVGAHLGEERAVYAGCGLNVVWLEANPELFQQLVQEITGFPSQKALPYLVADVEGKEFTFKISSNNGESSSIFDLGAHQQLWPDVTFTKSIQIKSVTLSALADRGEIDVRLYDALVMDTQGSELLVLKGATKILPSFKFIKTEAADFEVYKGSCQIRDLDVFLQEYGFKRIRTRRFAHKRGVGSCYDVTYVRRH